MSSSPQLRVCIVITLLLSACDAPVSDLVEFADASFSLESGDDCVAAFEGAHLSRAAAERGWDADDIDAFCTELADVATEYADGETLTTLTLAGTAQVSDEALQSAWFVSATGYDLDELRAWGEAVQEAEGVRACVRQARQLRDRDSTLDDGFATDCMAEQTGHPFPDPLFQEQRSSITIGSLDEDAVGAALSLAVYTDSGDQTVAAFVGGGFFAQPEPAYGAFIGCGAAIGFSEDADEDADAALCLLAEYREQ